MKNVISSVWAFVKQKRAYFLSFLLPPAILFIAYALFKVYPFGERSVLSLDLNAQYVYYFDYMYDVFAGKESLFYSWSRNLSGEFMGIIGYYLASPFNFIVWLFPRKMITEGLLAMMLAKTAAVGLTSCIFLKGHRGYSDTTSVVFSVTLAQCGFFVVQTMNPMWLDGLVALPLVVMGVERVCDKRKFLLYVLSLLYIFVANFYIGYMIGIFSALYFLYYMASGKSKNNKCFGEVCGATLMYGLSSVSAILMSCFMIFPVYKSLSNGKFTFSNPDYTPIENFNILDIIIKLFPTTYDTVRMEGLPVLYCGTLTLILAAVYFAARKIPARERISGAVLLGVLVVSMYVRPVDMMWHGGQMPNWLPYRYSFLISFLLIAFGAEAFENIRSIRAKSLGGSFALVLLMLLICDYHEGNDYFDTKLIILIPLGVLVIVGIMAYVFRQYKHPAVSVTLCTVVCAELLMNTTLTLYDMHDDIVFSTRASYLGDIPYSRKITDKIHELDSGFYRMEKTYHRCVNDPIALRMYGMSHSSSTLNDRAIELLKSLGFAGREHYTRSDGSTMLTDDIFGVKYILSKYACMTPYSETVDIENQLGVTVYKNPDALGIAYLADSDIIGWEFAEESPFVAQNKLAALLCGSDAESAEPVFKRTEDYTLNSSNINVGLTTDGHDSYRKRDTEAQAWIEWEVTIPEAGALYMFLPSEHERETKLYVNDEYRANYFKYENYSIEYITNLEADESVKIRLKLLDDAVFTKTPQFYYIDQTALDKFNAEMTARNAETTLVRNSGTSLSLTVNAAEDCALFTTIPIEEGWSAYIDGEPAALKSTLNSSLLCFEVPAGSHEIELRFFPAGLKVGLMFTASGALLLVIMLLVGVHLRKTENSDFPENDVPEDNNP
ncbi:MAG: YfhO family protein [Oscillospiraceae bacterium]